MFKSLTLRFPTLAKVLDIEALCYSSRIPDIATTVLNAGTNLEITCKALPAFTVFSPGIKEIASRPKLTPKFPTSLQSNPSDKSAPNVAAEEIAPVAAKATLSPGTTPNPALNQSVIAVPSFPLSEVIIIPPASINACSSGEGLSFSKLPSEATPETLS